MNLTQLLTRTRDLLKEPAAAFWTDAQVVRAINLRHRALAAEQLKLSQGFFLRTTTVDMVAGTDTYALPLDVTKIHRMERADQDPPIELTPISPQEAWAYRLTWPMLELQKAGAWYFLGKKFVVVPKPTVSLTAAFKIYYAKRQPLLHSGTATAGSTTTISFPNPPTNGEIENLANALEGTDIEITGGTGIGQIATITASTGLPTPTATFAALGTGLDTTSQYALIPEGPAEWHELIAYGAAIDCLVASKDDTTELTGHYNALYQLMVNQVGIRQEQAPDRVIWVPE